MTIANAYLKLKAILDEATASFWTSANLHHYLSSGQTQVTLTLLKIEDTIRKTDGNYRHPDLAVLINYADLALASPTATYNLPTGHLRTLSAEVKYTGVTQAWASEVSLAQLGHLRNNTYSIPTVTDPVFYIIGSTIGFFPIPDAGSGTVTSGHRYYKQPVEVTPSVEFILEDNLHEAIIEYAAYLAFEQDSETQEAQLHLQNFLSMIQ